MSSNNSTSNSGGIGVAGMLGVLFVGLKLTNYISWPWLWVLAPFWIPLVIAVGLLILVGILYLISSK